MISELTKSSIFIVGSILCGISLFYPFIVGITPTPDSAASLDGIGQFTDVESSEIVRQFLLATTCICLPILINQTLDICHDGLTGGSLERLVLLLFLITSSLGQCITSSSISADSSGEYSRLLFFCFFSLERWGLICIALITLHRLNTAAFTLSKLLPTLLIMFVAYMSRVAAYLNPSSVNVLVTSSFAYIYDGMLFFLILSGIFLCGQQHISSCFPCTQTHLLCVLIGGSVLCSVLFNTGILASSSFNPRELFTELFFIENRLLIILICLSVTLLPSWLLKTYAPSLRNTEDKENFVRFISHELRTPLSILMVGLDVVDSQLREGTRREDIISTVTDLKGPCALGVQILDDVLLFASMGTGVTVRKSKESLSTLLLREAETFRVLAMKKNIVLTVEEINDAVPQRVEVDASKVLKTILIE